MDAFPVLNTMFKQKANAAFNNAVFMAPTISRMHETAERLYFCAKQLRGISGQSELARALNVSPQMVKNWESRGISFEGMLKAERELGCRAVWLWTGQGTAQTSGASAAPCADTLITP